MYNLIYAFIVYVVANSLFNVCCLAAKPAIVKGQRPYYYTYVVKNIAHGCTIVFFDL